MESGAPFSIQVITYDARRKEGGKVVEYGEAVLLSAEEKESLIGRPKTQIEDWAERKATARRKAPKHRKWYTRNIRVLQDGHPTSIVRKIHPPLVTLFNQQIVVA